VQASTYDRSLHHQRRTNDLREVHQWRVLGSGHERRQLRKMWRGMRNFGLVRRRAMRAGLRSCKRFPNFALSLVIMEKAGLILDTASNQCLCPGLNIISVGSSKCKCDPSDGLVLKSVRAANTAVGTDP
jgi:hypothetical protein